MVPRRFFFYGTLIAGNDFNLARDAHTRLEPLGRASVKGQLFGIPDPLGWLPALLPGEGVVQGWLYETRIEFTANDVAALDSYEEFDPAGAETSMYRRVPMTVTMAEDGPVAADGYLFNQPLPQGACSIEGGDFSAWLVRHDLAPYIPPED